MAYNSDRDFVHCFAEAMMRIAVVLALGLMAGSCSWGGVVGDWMPHAVGGLPKDVPPRPGTPEYDEYQKRQEAERLRDKTKDAKTDPQSATNNSR